MFVVRCTGEQREKKADIGGSKKDRPGCLCGGIRVIGRFSKRLSARLGLGGRSFAAWEGVSAWVSHGAGTEVATSKNDGALGFRDYIQLSMEVRSLGDVAAALAETSSGCSLGRDSSRRGACSAKVCNVCERAREGPGSEREVECVVRIMMSA